MFTVKKNYGLDRFVIFCNSQPVFKFINRIGWTRRDEVGCFTWQMVYDLPKSRKCNTQSYYEYACNWLKENDLQFFLWSQEHSLPASVDAIESHKKP